MTDRTIITYIRVSTSQQGRSGLGIEAQRVARHHFAQTEGFEVYREFVEVESGKGADAMHHRPQLKAALAAARKQRCQVAVAKLDRLSRDVHFISGLMAHKVRSWLQNSDQTWIHSCCIYLPPSPEGACIDQHPNPAGPRSSEGPGHQAGQPETPRSAQKRGKSCEG